jgi:hypothetical protein
MQTQITSNFYGRIHILSEVHTSSKARSVHYDIKNLADQKKLVYLDEGINVGSKDTSYYHMPLDDRNIGIMEIILKELLHFQNIILEQTTEEYYYETRLNLNEGIILTESVYAVQFHIYSYNTTYDYFIKIFEIDKLSIWNDDYLVAREILNNAQIDSKGLSPFKPNFINPHNVSIFKKLISDLFKVSEILIKFYRNIASFFIDKIKYCRYTNELEKIKNMMSNPNYIYDAYIINLNLRHRAMVSNVIDAYLIFNLPIVVKVGRNHVIDKPEVESIISILIKLNLNYTLNYIDNHFDINKFIKKIFPVDNIVYSK